MAENYEQNSTTVTTNDKVPVPKDNQVAVTTKSPLTHFAHVTVTQQRVVGFQANRKTEKIASTGAEGRAEVTQSTHEERERLGNENHASVLRSVDKTVPRQLSELSTTGKRKNHVLARTQSITTRKADYEDEKAVEEMFTAQALFSKNYFLKKGLVERANTYI